MPKKFLKKEVAVQLLMLTLASTITTYMRFPHAKIGALLESEWSVIG